LVRLAFHTRVRDWGILVLEESNLVSWRWWNSSSFTNIWRFMVTRDEVKHQRGEFQFHHVISVSFKGSVVKCVLLLLDFDELINVLVVSWVIFYRLLYPTLSSILRILLSVLLPHLLSLSCFCSFFVSLIV